MFPCEARGKRPLDRLVPHGLKDASADPTTVERWWRAAPQANIGLVTGIAFDALDVDAAGWGPWSRLVAARGPVNLGPVAMTPGDGVHNFFTSTGPRNRAEFMPGCDWRGAGGYVIAPPSVHPNGSQYEWALSPDEAEIVAAPTWITDLLKHPEFQAVPDPSDTTWVSGVYGRTALLADCGRVALAPFGQRNDALYRAAFALGQLIASGVLDPYEVADALLIAATRSGLGEAEARRTTASGFDAGLAKPRRVSR